MIICLCRAKTDRDVFAAIEAGAESVSDLQECGIGTDCGSCHNMLRNMLAASRPAAALVALTFSVADESFAEEVA